MRERSVSSRRLYRIAGLLSLLVVVAFFLPGRERMRSGGPANAGHEQLACAQCHTPADGTTRQQIQANVRYLLGLRATAADFVHRPVGNDDCVACHVNESDRHAPYRFNEPRFAEARAAVAPQSCLSCHAEHNAQRVTREPTFCSYCHSDMEIREDPATPSHAALVSTKQWGTCLGCHDYHGNHVRETPLRLGDAATEADVVRYLRGGSKIYGDRLRHPARTERTLP